MSQIEITAERHIIYFDDRQQLISVYSLKVSHSQHQDPDPEEEPQPCFPSSEDNALLFRMWSQNTFTWSFESQYLDCKQLKEESGYGTIPFSLETFMEMHRDVRLHKFAFEPKAGVQKETLGRQDCVGKITFRTQFKSNPFMFPLRALDSEANKRISIVVPGDQVGICSGELLEEIMAEEVDGWVSQKQQQSLRVFEYAVSGNTDSKLICVFKGRLEYRKFTIQGADMVLMYPHGQDPASITPLKEVFLKLSTVAKPKTAIIIRGVDTPIKSADGITFWSRNCTDLYQRILRTQLLGKIKDEWIIEGMCTYRTGFRHLHTKFNELCQLVKRGEEFSPLIDDTYSMDETWKLKATVLYHIFTNITHQEQKLTHILLSSIKEDRKMTTESFMRTIKNKYGIATLKPYEQFIKHTGITKFYYEFSYTKKENKIKLRIRQKPLQSKVYQMYNSWRIRLEETYNVKSILIERILEKNKIAPGEENTKRKDNLQGPLLVPLVLKSNSFVKGKLPISLAETNESEVREENYDIKIKKKKINKENLTCRNKLRKMINKKGGIEKEMAAQPSWMKLDPTQTYLFAYHNENVDSVRLLKQLIWQNNEMELLKVLQYVRNELKDTAIVEQLCKMLEIKETNLTSMPVRQEILTIFPAILSHCDDRKPWDCLVGLLRLYEPICYDRSLQGHHFKTSLLQCLSKLKPRPQFNSYLEEFQRIMLAMSKDCEVIFPGREEVQFRKSLYKAMLSWRTKHIIQILNEVYQVALVYLFKEENFSILKVIVDKVFNLGHLFEEDSGEAKIVIKLKAILSEAMSHDTTHRLWLINFQNKMHGAEASQTPTQFFMFMYYELEQTRTEMPEMYEDALQVVKNILSKSRKKYACDLQINGFNPNQNYFIAERLWEKLTTGESLYVPGVRLLWMKIYRVFYFYFTPVAVMYKLKYDKEEDPFALPLTPNDREEILANIKDFTPDVQWFSGYDIVNKKSESLKEQDKEEIDRMKQRRIRHRTEVNLESTKIMARWVKKNPDKEVNWVQLSKYMLDVIISKHENKRTPMETINQLKGVKKKLKRGNMPAGYTFEKLQKSTISILEEGKEEIETISELIRQTKEILQKVVVRQSDTKFILPMDVLKMETPS